MLVQHKYSFSIKRTPSLLLLSLPLDLLILVAHGDTLNPIFSKSSIYPLISAAILSFTSIQYSILSYLIKLQRLTLTSKDTRVALIAGLLLFIFGTAEAMSLIANQNLISILISIWIFSAALISARKELKSHEHAIKDTKKSAALFLRRTTQQDQFLNYLPLFLLRIASLSLIFDAHNNNSHIIVYWLIVLGTATLMLMYRPNETARVSQCPRCRTPSLRALVRLSNCQSCEAEEVHAAPAKAAPRVKITSSSSQRILEIERPLAAALAGATDAPQKPLNLHVMRLKMLAQQHSHRSYQALSLLYCLFSATAQNKSDKAYDRVASTHS